MSDNEIEDIQFLPGSSAGKRGVYEPHGLQKCKQFICSPLATAAIVASVLAVIFCVALIAALARPPAQCTNTETTAPLVSVPPTSPADRSFPWRDLRLPRDVKPQFYELFLHPNLTTFTFSGTVSITLHVDTDTSFIVFHSKNLTLLSTQLYDEQQVKLDTSPPQVSTDHEQVYLEASEGLKQGHTYILAIEFSGLLQDNLAGFYRSVYTTKSGHQRWIAATQFEATDARAAFPCFDEPDLKAKFKLSIVRDTDYITLSNTPIIDHGYLDTNPKLIVDRFNTTLKMSTYLVAFVICDFKVVNAQMKDGRQVNIYAPAAYIEEASLASEVAPDILEYYEQFYGVKYPLEKSDHIAIPDFSAGAMENWGLITYRLKSLLVNTTSASPMDQQWVVMVIAHELAHQWFGNLVTMQWWNDLWLNEGFASYVEYKGTDSVKPDWNMFDQFLLRTTWIAMTHDGLKSSHPISTDAKDPAEIEELFDAISYDKGAAIIRMLESFLGEDNFQKGLQQYLTKYRYSNARTEDLWTSLSQQADEGIDVVAVMKTWTEQMGYPVVSVTRDGDTLTMTQKRFLFNNRSQIVENFKSPYGYKWHIPLSYTTDTISNDEPALEWMTPDTESLNINLDAGNKWVKFNVKHTGVYRVNYSPDMYKALIDQLNADHTVFSAADRASLLEDVFALARSGDVLISQALNLSRYLKKETEYVPWETAMQGFRYISHLMADKSTYSDLEKYCLSLMSSLLEQNPWNEVEGQMNKYRQEMILGNALYLQHSDTIHTALEMYRQWMNGTDVKPSVKLLVYKTGAKYGGMGEWEYLYSQYQSASELEKKELLLALSSTTDGVRLQRLLDLSLNGDEVRTQDASSLVSSIAANPAGHVLAWNFVKKNWDTIYSRFTGMAFQLKHFIKIPQHLTTQYDYNDVKDFYEKNLPGHDHLTVNQTLEHIEMNIDWLSRNRVNLETWLKNNNDEA